MTWSPGSPRASRPGGRWSRHLSAGTPSGQGRTAQGAPENRRGDHHQEQSGQRSCPDGRFPLHTRTRAPHDRPGRPARVGGRGSRKPKRRLPRQLAPALPGLARRPNPGPSPEAGSRFPICHPGIPLLDIRPSPDPDLARRLKIEATGPAETARLRARRSPRGADWEVCHVNCPPKGEARPKDRWRIWIAQREIDTACNTASMNSDQSAEPSGSSVVGPVQHTLGRARPTRG
jgi:hypothetical protein